MSNPVTPNSIIENTKQELAEWLDMTDDPYKVVCHCLAKKISQMEEYIVYLERRVKAYDAASSYNEFRAHSWEH